MKRVSWFITFVLLNSFGIGLIKLSNALLCHECEFVYQTASKEALTWLQFKTGKEISQINLNEAKACHSGARATHLAKNCTKDGFECYTKTKWTVDMKEFVEYASAKVLRNLERLVNTVQVKRGCGKISEILNPLDSEATSLNEILKTEGVEERIEYSKQGQKCTVKYITAGNGSYTIDTEAVCQCNYDYCNLLEAPFPMKITGPSIGKQTANKWSDCSKPCGDGIKYRRLEGKLESETCNVEICPICHYRPMKLNVEKGSFETPLLQLAQTYPPNVDCRWYIQAPPGNTIVVTFEEFDLFPLEEDIHYILNNGTRHSKRRCMDRLEITDLGKIEAKASLKVREDEQAPFGYEFMDYEKDVKQFRSIPLSLCGIFFELPWRYTSTSNEIMIRFVAKYNDVLQSIMDPGSPYYFYIPDERKGVRATFNYQPTDVCQSKPCLNGGTCLEDPDSTSKYRCNCRANFSGRRCELPKDHLLCYHMSCFESGENVIADNIDYESCLQKKMLELSIRSHKDSVKEGNYIENRLSGLMCAVPYDETLDKTKTGACGITAIKYRNITDGKVLAVKHQATCFKSQCNQVEELEVGTTTRKDTSCCQDQFCNYAHPWDDGARNELSPLALLAYVMAVLFLCR